MKFLILDRSPCDKNNYTDFHKAQFLFNIHSLSFLSHFLLFRRVVFNIDIFRNPILYGVVLIDNGSENRGQICYIIELYYRVCYIHFCAVALKRMIPSLLSQL